MKGGKTDKMGIILGMGISAAVIVTLGLYISMAEINFAVMFESFIVIMLVVFATFVVIGKAKSVKRGLPASDELTKKVMHKAGYYTFLCTIYLALGTGFYNSLFLEDAGLQELEVGQVTGIIIIGSALLFFLFYFWFNRKGDVK